LGGVHDEIGWTELAGQLGPAMPTGCTIDVTHVEADQGANQFLPAFGCPGDLVNELACSDNTCGLHSELTVNVNAGTEYFIRVFGKNLFQYGAFTLDLTGPACVAGIDCDGNGTPDLCEGLPGGCDGSAADVCDQAQPVCTGVSYPGNIPFLLGGEGDSSCAVDVGSDVWYRYIPAAGGQLTVSLCKTVAVWDSMLSIHAGSNAMAGKAILPQSTGATASSHATSVAQNFYGQGTSIAPDISTVDVYRALNPANLFVNDWLGSGALGYQLERAPLIETRRVQNHSWVWSPGPAFANDMLRRIDHVVHRDGVVVVAAVNNGSGSTMPELLSSAYNGITVGLTDGNSSTGPTPATVDGPGRAKPDIVAPASTTSYATPIVAASVALLLEIADADDILRSIGNAARRRMAKALVTKAALLSGATKEPFSDWSRTTTRPLDLRYGAGQVNIAVSHDVLTFGRQWGGAGGDVDYYGWDFDTLVAGEPRWYFFTVPANATADTLSIIVAWNRRIDVTLDSPNPAILTPSMADINLRFYEAVADAPGALIDESVSPIDNVEHVFQRDVPPGRYVMEVISDTDWDYAIAWSMPNLISAPADVPVAGARALFVLGLLMLGVTVMTLRRNPSGGAG
jgi:hypothetical protein